jgi:hypothetical protein
MRNKDIVSDKFCDQTEPLVSSNLKYVNFPDKRAAKKAHGDFLDYERGV